MSAQTLLQRLLKSREFRVEIAPGKSITMRRPAESDIRALLAQVDGDRWTVRVTMPDVVAATVGWSGITEDDVLGGGGLGSEDPAEFSPELWAAYVADHSDVFARVSQGLVQAITAHLEARADAAKN